MMYNQHTTSKHETHQVMRAIYLRCKKAEPPPASDDFASRSPSISSSRFDFRVSKAPLIHSHLGFKASAYCSFCPFIVFAVSFSSVASVIFSSVSATCVSSVFFFVLRESNVDRAASRCSSYSFWAAASAFFVVAISFSRSSLMYPMMDTMPPPSLERPPPLQLAMTAARGCTHIPSRHL